MARRLVAPGVALAIGVSWLWAAVAAQAPPPPVMASPFSAPDRAATLATAFPEIDRLFAEYRTGLLVPGGAYGIVIDGHVAHLGASGVSDLAAGTPVDAETVFRIASMTKSFTAMAILRLRDEGRLALDDPAERYVPELATLVYPTRDSPRITIRHLLSHAEGFPEDNPWGDRQLAATDEDMGRMMRQGIPFSTAPGTAYEYSNYGFAILGRIVARVSGRPYAAYVRDTILLPLGMTSTTLEAASVPRPRLARGYRHEDGVWKDEPPLPDGAFGAMGGMLTSSRDLARYVGFLMSAWPPRDDPETGPIRRSSAREMQQVWRSSPVSVSRGTGGVGTYLSAGGYGFGLRVWESCEFVHVVGHSGGLPGFGSHMRWLPEHGVGIFMMGNVTYGGGSLFVDRAFEALRRTGALVRREPVPGPALTAMRDKVSRLVTAWQDDLAEEIAADNLFLDESQARRRATFAGLMEQHGTCRPVPGRLDALNALRGSWPMACERGALMVTITLAPTVPPRVQMLSVQSLDRVPDPRPRAGACQ